MCYGVTDAEFAGIRSHGQEDFYYGDTEKSWDYRIRSDHI